MCSTYIMVLNDLSKIIMNRNYKIVVSLQVASLHASFVSCKLN
jgi:hypothetical protein